MPITFAAITHYLMTGESDTGLSIWNGRDFLESARKADAALREALIAAVLSRSIKLDDKHGAQISDLAALTRAKVEPMVTGLFPAVERPFIMSTLDRSVIFLLPENIESILRSMTWLGTAWTLANMYLLSFDAEPTSEEARDILGLSHETTCFLTVDYLVRDDERPLDDYLVHEAAHVFHNCRRTTVGLPETRTRQHLLNIKFRKRETFAYSCEAYSRILATCRSPADRLAAVEAHSTWVPPDDSVDPAEYHDILREAIGARNGWKRILQRCAPD